MVTRPLADLTIMGKNIDQLVPDNDHRYLRPSLYSCNHRSIGHPYQATKDQRNLSEHGRVTLADGAASISAAGLYITSRLAA